MSNDRWRDAVRAQAGGWNLDPDVLDEIAEHAAEMYRERVGRGEGPAAAEAAVRRELATLPAPRRGDRRRPASVLHTVPAARPGPLTFARDLGYAVRLLRVRPGFTLVAVLTLALGIGANTAIFGMVHTLLLAPLPFPDPARLVMLWEKGLDNGARFIIAAPNWHDWRRRSTSFEEMALWEVLRFNLSGEDEPAQVVGMRATAGLFTVLGVRPQLGRVFTEAEQQPGHDVVVISHALWRGHFSGRTDIIGRRTRVNGRPFEVIGVMPETFVFEQRRHHLWVPLTLNTEDAGRDSHSFRGAARLKPHVTFEAARAEMDAIGRQLALEYPVENRRQTADITPMGELGVVELRPTLQALLAAVAFVLLIACVNVANLLLARAGTRRREFAIRSALGAGRARLVSQLLAEGAVLSVAGGVAGLALAWFGTQSLATVLPSSIRFAPFRHAGEPSLDAAVLAFTFVTAVLTGLLFSLAPIVAVLRTLPGDALRVGGRGATGSGGRLRATLVAVEVALAVVVLAGAGLMIKSVARLLAVDPGLDARNVLVMSLALPQLDFYGPAERAAFCADVSSRVAGIPGVVEVGAVSHLPLSGANAGRGMTIEGRPVHGPDDGASAAYRVTCPGYFASLGIPVVRGRDFTHADARDAAQTVIVNQAMAEAYWPGADPVGRRLRLGPPGSTAPWLTVVGVVANVRHFGLDTEAAREMFRPYPQAAWPVMTVTVKTSLEPQSVVAPVRTALRKMDPDQAVVQVYSMDEVIEGSLAPRRFPMLLLGLFSAVALTLAAVGVYGVVSYVVSQRMKEIGIRMALGARAGQVVAMVAGRSLVPVGVGLAAGAVGALAASRLLSTLLYDVAPHDPGVLTAILGILGASALLASLIPARRAAGVDPLIVLREE